MPVQCKQFWEIAAKRETTESLHQYNKASSYVLAYKEEKNGYIERLKSHIHIKEYRRNEPIYATSHGDIIPSCHIYARKCNKIDTAD